jgi:hypothetical protein
MMVVDWPLVAARHDHHRTVLHISIVDHDADRGEILVGVRVERQILVPLDRGAIAGRHMRASRNPKVVELLTDLGLARAYGVGESLHRRHGLLSRAVTFAHCWPTLRARLENEPAEWRRPWARLSATAVNLGVSQANRR